MSYLGQAGGKLSAGWKSGIDKIGSALPTDAAIAEKLGMGQYKPKQVGINEQAFTDMTRSDEQMELLKRQMEGAEGRKFTGAQSARLGTAQTMNAVQLDPASRMRAASLGPAAQMRGATIDQKQQAEFRAGQQDLIAALQAQAAGEGPSLAAMQMDDARQQNIATAMAMAASQRGLGAGQGLRQIADQTQMANQQAARDAVRGRLAEQMAAQGQLGSVLSGARAQDIGLATDQAGLMQQAGLANQAASNQFALQQAALQQDAAARNQAALNQFALTQGAMGQEAALQNMAAGNQFRLQQGMFDQQTSIANQQAALQAQAQQDALMQALTSQMGQQRLGQDTRLMDLARMQFERDFGLENMAASAYGARQKRVSNFVSGLAGGAASAGSAGSSAAGGLGGSGSAGGAGAAGASGGGSAAAGAAVAASDENLKTNIKSDDSEISKFLDALSSHSYDYKDKKYGQGRFISPMAQELEKSSIGKAMVIDTPEGKMVDYARGSGTYLAAASMLNRRLKEIEKRIEKRA